MSSSARKQVSIVQNQEEEVQRARLSNKEILQILLMEIESSAEGCLILVDDVFYIEKLN